MTTQRDLRKVDPVGSKCLIKRDGTGRKLRLSLKKRTSGRRFKVDKGRLKGKEQQENKNQRKVNINK